MADSITLEEVLNLAKQLSPLDRIRLIEQITPHEPSQKAWVGSPPKLRLMTQRLFRLAPPG